MFPTAEALGSSQQLLFHFLRNRSCQIDPIHVFNIDVVAHAIVVVVVVVVFKKDWREKGEKENE